MQRGCPAVNLLGLALHRRTFASDATEWRLERRSPVGNPGALASHLAIVIDHPSAWSGRAALEQSAWLRAYW